MARIRSIKPEFWDDRKLAVATTRDARLLYIGLWNQADEHARVNGDPVWIAGHVFPYESDIGADEVARYLDELARGSWVVKYTVHGDPYLFLPKLAEHQRLEPEKVASRHPSPDEADPETASDQQVCTDPRGAQVFADEVAPDADKDALLYVAGSREHVAGSREHVVSRADPRGHRLPDDWIPDPGLIEAMRVEGIPDALAIRELPRFRDYWTAQPGAKGRKADWPATWRNWLRRANDAPATNGRASPASTTDARLAQALAVRDQVAAEEATDARKALP